jgi:hypothetical protein
MMVPRRKKAWPMRDPHVKSLRYTVTSEGTAEYIDPEPFDMHVPLGHFSISDGILRVEPAEHFADETQAKAAIDPYLRDWESSVDLVADVGDLRFQFDGSETIDRDPPPLGSPVTVTLHGVIDLTLVGGIPTVRVSRNQYPRPLDGV